MLSVEEDVPLVVLLMTAKQSGESDWQFGILTWGDGKARVYMKDALDPHFTGEIHCPGDEIEIPYFEDIPEAISFYSMSPMLAVCPVQVRASAVESYLGVPLGPPPPEA